MTSAASPAPALLALRDAIDARWPRRSRSSDGIMGDENHQARKSDHNDGNALDLSHDPTDGPDLEALAEVLLGDPRTHYIIWNKRIRNRAFQGGAWRPYTGASPHTAHLHISVLAERREDTSPWTLPDLVTSDVTEREDEDAAANDDRRAGALVAGVGLLVVVALLVRHAEQPGRAPRTNRVRGYM